MALVIIYAGLCDRMPLTRKLAVNMQIFALSDVSGAVVPMVHIALVIQTVALKLM